MGLDIRIPIGLLFAVMGAILIIGGLVLSSEIYRSSLGININLVWGSVMLTFGLAMVFLGVNRRGTTMSKLGDKDHSATKRS